MAYKQKIPQAWKNIHPNVAKLPFIYNLDDAVGIGSPNKRLDVMMVQVFLQRWDTIFFWTGSRDVVIQRPAYRPEGALPPNGAFDNRTLAWIFWYQLYTFGGLNQASLISGKVTPAAADGSSLLGIHTLLYLEGQMLDEDSGELKRNWFFDLSTDPNVPRDLVDALKNPR
ncbi:MAG: hypothetical protein WBE37_06190 [Bryobacteraceae bacterium]